MSLIAVLLIVQIWLWSAALESLLAGQPGPWQRTAGSDILRLEVSDLLRPLAVC
jgi:hypothetical protein